MKAGSVSQMRNIFIPDSSSSVGAGLTGLVFNSAGLSVHFIRDGDATATAITLVTATVGTFTSSGFIEVDATNMPGIYQLGIPDAAIAVSADFVDIHFKGATDMTPATLHIELEPKIVNDLVDLSAAAVNAEVVDVMKVDTIPEQSQGVPPATPTFEQVQAWFWATWRNQLTANATEAKVRNDSGTVLAKASLSDGAGVFTKGEFVSGP